jgi:hypothetical protein
MDQLKSLGAMASIIPTLMVLALFACIVIERQGVEV